MLELQQLHSIDSNIDNDCSRIGYCSASDVLQSQAKLRVQEGILGKVCKQCSQQGYYIMGTWPVRQWSKQSREDKGGRE